MEYLCCKDQGRRYRNSWLTHELVVEILSRLPVKSLQKFRCVCKSWNSAIARDSYLVTQHLINRSRRPNSSDGILSLSYLRIDSYWHKRPTLQYSVGDDYSRPVGFDLDAVVPPMDDEFHYYSVTNSCDGLVGVLDISHFYIANPSIKKLAALPIEGHGLERHEHYQPLAGIGFDASTGEYKAVRLFQYDSYRLYNQRPHRYPSTGCEVYALKPGSRWRFVGDAPYVPYDEALMDLCNEHLPVVVDGAVYWTVLHLTVEEEVEPDVALRFDLRDEKFDVIMHPEGSSRPETSRVVSLGGRLCVVDKQNCLAQMNIWALTDYERRKWAKLYKFSIAVHSFPVTIRRDGIMVVYDGKGRRDYYDTQTGNFIMYEKCFRYEPAALEQVITYTDSLLWPF